MEFGGVRRSWSSILVEFKEALVGLVFLFGICIFLAIDYCEYELICG